jgi:hypothetical protein
MHEYIRSPRFNQLKGRNITFSLSSSISLQWFQLSAAALTAVASAARVAAAIIEL